MFGLSGTRRRYVNGAFFTLITGFAVYLYGNWVREPFTFNVGLAVTIFALTMFANLLFHEWWVEQKGKGD
jgi:hypothetical protein